jgi:hypothetical protein
MNQMLKVSATLGLAGGIALSAHTLISAGARCTTQAKVMSEYKSVKLGMKRDAVKTALGNPEASTDASDDFKLNGDDTMTVHYENGEVKAIQLSFFNPERAPAWNDVVGDAEVKELPNGAKTARKTLETEKFWVSIYQTKDRSNTRITISR